MDQKEMTLSQRLVHLWTYYKAWILLGSLGIIIVIYALVQSVGIHKDTSLQITLVNADTITVSDSKLFDHYEESRIDNKYEKIEVEAILRIQIDNANQLSGTSYQVLSAKFLSGEIDLFISDRKTLEYLSVIDCFADLEEILSEEEIQRYQEYFIYRTNEETKERYPAGISLVEFPRFNQEGFFREEAALGIGAIAKNPENAVKLLNYLFGD